MENILARLELSIKRCKNASESGERRRTVSKLASFWNRWPVNNTCATWERTTAPPPLLLVSIRTFSIPVAVKFRSPKTRSIKYRVTQALVAGSGRNVGRYTTPVLVLGIEKNIISLPPRYELDRVGSWSDDTGRPTAVRARGHPRYADCAKRFRSASVGAAVVLGGA